MRAAAALLSLVGVLAARPLRAGTLASAFDSPLTRPVGVALAASVGGALPVIAASPGVTFTFDKATHGYERRTEILGQLFLERPRPLGRGRWNVSLSYEWVPVDTVDDQDLDDLSDTRFPIVDRGGGPDFTVPRFDVDLDAHVAAASVTWGATDALDLNLTVPVVTTRLRLDVTTRARGAGFVSLSQARVRETKVGVGDLFLRAKHHLRRGRLGDLAAGLVLRLPSGEEENFQGTGSFQAAPMLYAASPSFRMRTVRLDAYLNAGVDLKADDVTRSEARIGAGLDAALGQNVTLAVGVLGREAFADLAPPGFFDVTRVDARSGRRLRAPFLGLERDRASAWDLSAGGRVDVWRDTVFAFVNVLVPLDRDGVHTGIIPVVGVEAAF